MRLALRSVLLSAISVVFVAGVASAHVENGDFEDGGNHWTVNVPPGWNADFPTTGGNPDGFGHIVSPSGNSGGIGCISQTFDCGFPAPGLACFMTVDYRLKNLDAAPGTGRVKIFVDGILKFVSPVSDDIDWTGAEFNSPCGDHDLVFCLEVDNGNNLWEAGFDNADGDCDIVTSTESQTWGRVKSLYR